MRHYFFKVKVRANSYIDQRLKGKFFRTLVGLTINIDGDWDEDVATGDLKPGED